MTGPLLIGIDVGTLSSKGVLCTPAGEILAECNRGMAELGERFARQECFLPELMFGGMIMKTVTAELSPLLEKQEEGVESAGKVVIGTVQHDVHDIGKDIVVMMLRGVGFEVIDLGVDVPPEKFVEAAKEHDADLVGLSALLTTTMPAIKTTVDAIKAAGQDVTKVVIGGAPVNQQYADLIDADGYAPDAVAAVELAKELLKEWL